MMLNNIYMPFYPILFYGWLLLDLPFKYIYLPYFFQVVLDEATTAWGIKVERVEM